MASLLTAIMRFRSRAGRTETAEPEALTRWWDERLGEAHAAARPARVTRHEPGIYGPLAVHDVEFSGAHGDQIRGRYLRPPGSGGRDVPVVVKFIGYGGGRGTPTEHTALPATGYALLVMDTRGQGGRWSTGATGDPAANGTGPENASVMTRGITRPEDYYRAPDPAPEEGAPGGLAASLYTSHPPPAHQRPPGRAFCRFLRVFTAVMSDSPTTVTLR
jgi:cephalosporin-C deacetylase-like acetyl esterase